MIIIGWLLVFVVHSLLFMAPLEAELKPIKEDVRDVLLYALACIAVFCYCAPMSLAVVMSCVYACFYVLCGTGLKIAFVFTPQRWRWPMFVGMSNLHVGISISFLFELYYYG